MQLSVAGCLSQQQNRLFSSLMDRLAVKLGFEVVVTTPETAHIVYMCGLPTGLALDRLAPWVAPVMNDPGYHGLPIYFSDLVTRPDFEPRTWLDLVGTRFAYNEPLSFSGSVAVRLEMQRRSLPSGFFDWRRTGSHRASLDLVMTGGVDVAAIDSMVLDLEGPPREEVTVFARLGPYPMPPISTSRTLDENLRKEATELMVSLHQDVAGSQRLEEFGISHLARVDEAPYRSLGESVSDLDLSSPDSDVA
jgi:ABC-type phosphate/phosphonate transport system substrate-binding protein